jgi:hypothetical protein
MSLYTKKFPSHGWIHPCKECKRPTAKELHVFVLSKHLDDSYRVCYCQPCFRTKIIIGSIEKLEYYMAYKSRVTDLTNAVIIWKKTPIENERQQ